MAKGNGKQREGGHDSKVARKEVKVCETAWGRVVRWKGKGREGKTRRDGARKKWHREGRAGGGYSQRVSTRCRTGRVLTYNTAVIC